MDLGDLGLIPEIPAKTLVGWGEKSSICQQKVATERES